MPCNSRIAALVLTALVSVGCAKQSQQVNIPDPKIDTMILMSLDSARNNDFSSSLKYNKELFKLTNDEHYLQKAISYSYKTNDYKAMEDLSLMGMKRFTANKNYYKRQYIVSQVTLKNFDNALKEAKLLLKTDPSSENYELIGNIYYNQEDYENSLKYYESSYAIDQNEITLIKLTNVLYSYLNQKDTALAYLETFLQTKGCSAKVCDKLMLIYQEQGNIDGMLSILNKMYNKYKQNPALKKTTIIIQNIILSLLEKKDIKKAIKFLEQNNIDQSRLLNLYYQNGQLQKALMLTKKLYKKTKDPELLGKIAIYRFEMAKDKRKVLKNVIANFELALSSGINNPSYQNYYGYLLIDFDLDVKKGVELVKKALVSAPNNLAYLDSLAWGYYKLNRCEEAKEVMSKVILQAGLKDAEIRMHWEKIENCKNK